MMRVPDVDGTYICVDTSDGKAKRVKETRVRGNSESDQSSNGEYPSEKTRLDGPPNKSVENCIRPAEATSPTGENNDQCNCKSRMGSFRLCRLHSTSIPVINVSTTTCMDNQVYKKAMT